MTNATLNTSINYDIEMVEAISLHANESERIAHIATLAEILAYSFCKSMHRTTSNESFRELTIDIARHSANADAISRALDATIITFTNDGDAKAERDAEAEAVIDTRLNECIGDGVELVNQSFVILCDEYDYAIAKGIERPLIEKYIKFYPNNRGIVTLDGDKPAFIEKELTMMGHAFKALRTWFTSRFNSVKFNPRDGYTYLSTCERDAEGNEHRFYLRTEKYADIGGDAYEFGGYSDGVTASKVKQYATKETVTDAEYRESVAFKRMFLTSLKLTERQTQIAEMSTRYTRAQIARKMHITEATVTATLRRVRERVFKLYGVTTRADAEKAYFESVERARENEKKAREFDECVKKDKKISNYEKMLELESLRDAFDIK